MVNCKNVAFKVTKQAPSQNQAPQPVGTVLNCRKSTAKGAQKFRNVTPREFVLTGVVGSTKKRKRKTDEEAQDSDSPSLKQPRLSFDGSPGSASATPNGSSFGTPMMSSQSSINQDTKPRRRSPKLSTRKVFERFNSDVWWHVMEFSNPAQLLEWRGTIEPLSHLLRQYPHVWKTSREYCYGNDLPDPPAEINEFQYAHLRHGSGCMSCGAKNTRKTYWAFLRRWCKSCLDVKQMREPEVIDMLRTVVPEDPGELLECLPVGINDSWGNYLGVGPANAHTQKNVYLKADAEQLIQEYQSKAQDNPETWQAEVRAWCQKKSDVFNQRRVFAQKMEAFEEKVRNQKTLEHQAKKDARKKFYAQQAAMMMPPMTVEEMEKCPCYKRAILIPKDPNMTSWTQLKPKLEMEWAEYLANGQRQMEMDEMEGAENPAVEEPARTLPSIQSLLTQTFGDGDSGLY